VAGHEEVVIVEYEDVDAPRALHLDHFVSDVLDLAQAIAFAWQTLLLPSCDTADAAIRVAATTRDQGGDRMREARGGLPAPIGPRQLRNIR
jgi:hypothetical protein